MLFNSVEYLLLLSVSLVLYWATPWLRARRWILLAASIYFYMSWSRVFVLMLLSLVAVNWVVGWKLDKTRKRFWLIFACVLNLGLLAYFKYANFFIDNLGVVARIYDPSIHFSHLSIILPLGISFYVFELISYQADIYRGKISHESNFVVFAIFVLFFPHLIAGPICRPSQFMPQLHARQSLDWTKFYNGMYMFLAGFALKTGIADGLAPFVNVIFAHPVKYSGFDNLMAVIGFGVQILCDFWGYSLMALGAALLFGYVLPHNFNLPYAATSIRDFWRRWHITLSNWLRDYLYIALGGNRVDRAWKIKRNLALTMLLGGLWHGASWNFIIWGGMHGLALAVNRWFEDANAPRLLKTVFSRPAAAWFLTMAVVFAAWIYFRAPNFDDAAGMVHRILIPHSGWSNTKLAPGFFELLILYLPLQWLIHRTTYQSDVTRLPIWMPSVAAACLAVFSVIYYVNGNEFIYFQF